MAFWDWLRKAAGTISSGWDWLKQTVKPATDFLRQVPVVGDFVRTFDPITNLVDKTSNTLGQVGRNERLTTLPTGTDVINAGVAAGQVYNGAIDLRERAENLASQIF